MEIKTRNKKSAEAGIAAYCVRCKEKQVIKDPVKTTTKNGQNAVKGTCVECGCKVMAFVKGRKK